MYTLNCNGRMLVVDEPIVMGIINVTPDSFFSGSRYEHAGGAVAVAEQMLNEGALIIDVGGQSTRPGSEQVDEATELQRVVPVIKAIASALPSAIISIDTFYSSVARAAIHEGASIINDISAGSMDSNFFKTVAELKTPYVLMHMKGVPGSMQDAPNYEDVTKEVLDFFIRKLNELRNAGITDVIIDPGFGFGKTIAHNFELLEHLAAFRILERPVLVGLSRKSTIWRTLNIDISEALNGTTVLNTVALMKGASILRVHDVKEAVEAVKLCGKVKTF